MKKCILYGHGGCYNHGAEAITSTTIRLIKETIDNAKIILSTHFIEQDKKFLNNVDKYFERDMTYWEEAKKSKNSEEYIKHIYKSTLDAIDEESICFSIGGDNYCYDNWNRWKTINDYANEKGAKGILWGCSIEPSMIDNKMLEALENHKLIIARESITYSALKEKGIKTNVKLIPDIAFLLEPKEVKLPQNFKIKNTLGINVSPLSMRSSNNEDEFYKSIIELIEYTLANTEMNIALIPHVMMNSDNDYDLLSRIFNDINNKERVILIDDYYSASEYKFIISKCRFFIGARTHSTIAAYSSCVPTLCIGYSVKSEGIGVDIMGGTDSYVIKSTEITSKNIIELFKDMIYNEDKDKNHLELFMPQYIQKAKNGYKAIIHELLES